MRSGRVLLVLGVLSLVFAPAATAKPGTAKSDGPPADAKNDNEPHVSCPFDLRLSGFAEDPDLFLKVTVSAHSPTKGGVIDERSIFVGEDPDGGAGDLDAVETYNIGSALASITPHKKQGWHVKIEAAFPDGTKKSKTIWITDCDPSQPDPDPDPDPQPDPEPTFDDIEFF